MRKIYLLFVTVLFIVSGYKGYAQPGKFQAVFIFNFYKQMEWPADYKNSDFIIGIIGDSPVIPMLEKLKTTQTGKTKFIITRFNSVSEVTKCHMLFLPVEKSDLFDAALKKISGTPTLFITEKPGLGGRGSAINFVEANDRLRFELNQTAVRKSNIKVSEMLKSLAILI